MSYSPYLDTTAHDAAYQAQLDREGLREAWIDRRAQEIRGALYHPGPHSGLDDCLREMMSPDLAMLIMRVVNEPHVTAALERRLDEVIDEYAYTVATNEADSER